jgi:hypothetical protein
MERLAPTGGGSGYSHDPSQERFSLRKKKPPVAQVTRRRRAFL